MKKLFQKQIFVFFAAIFFLAVVSVPIAFGQASPSEIQFVQQLSKFLESGDIESALKHFETMPSELSNNVDMMVLKASLLLSAEKDSEAEELATSLLNKNQNNIDVLELNVMIAKKKGDSAKKKQLLKQILVVNPKNPDANIELADEQALKRNYRNARDYYKKALSSDPENLDALFGYGKMCYYMEKDDDSKEAFNKILELDPRNPQANAYMAKFEAENNQYKKAISYLNVAIQEEPNNSDYYFDLGTYKRYLGDYKGAEKSWLHAISLDPEYFLGYAYLAGLYDEQNKSDLALENYKKVIEKNPKYYYAYESLGIFAWGKEDYAEAQKAFEKAREYNSDNISYVLMICACMMKQKRVQDVRLFTEKLMKKMPDRQGMEYKLVRMYHDKGGDADVALKIQKETNRTKKGKYLFYLALYYELINKDSLAQKYYTEVANMQSPMFFEYRLAQWKVNK